MEQELIGKLFLQLESQVGIVDDILQKYVNDEVGECQKQRYDDMGWVDKVSLLTKTLTSCSSWEDFETDLVINFDYSNY